MFDVSFGYAAFIGLLSFLSPCILPIVPFYLCYMAGLSMSEMTDEGGIPAATRRRMLFAAVAFSLGIITIFAGLGASATIFGQQLRDSFGWLRYVAAAIILIMGLHFLGVFRIGLLDREARFESSGAPSSVFGAYLVGLAFAFGWTPCVGPGLSMIMMTASAEDTVWRGVLLLITFGAGMTLPFVLAALFVGPFMQMMRNFRRYMPYVEKTMGVFLVLFAILIGTNSVNYISEWMLNIAPDIGTLQ